MCKNTHDKLFKNLQYSYLSHKKIALGILPIVLEDLEAGSEGFVARPRWGPTNDVTIRRIFNFHTLGGEHDLKAAERSYQVLFSFCSSFVSSFYVKKILCSSSWGSKVLVCIWSLISDVGNLSQCWKTYGLCYKG